MYLQITTRCNMSCKHCCYSCTAVGEDMTIKTFRNALNKLWDDNTSIGGGEPTLHPKFWQILGECISESDYVWLATNGSITKTALALAKMAKKEIIGCELSQDWYHDEIDETVVEAFKGKYRDVSGKEVKQGRAGENGIGQRLCVCGDLIVKPNGDVFACGCEDAPCFGSVNKEVNIPEDWQFGECWKDQEVMV